MTNRDAGGAGAGRLAVRLTVFLALGGAGALVLWYALHHLLAGSAPDLPLWLIAAGGLLFVVLVAVLRRKTALGLDGGDVPEDERGPVGTLFLLMVYIMVLAGMWGTMYWILLRS